MKQSKAIILWHNGGRLANQLWLFVSVYAFCLETGRTLDNYSFFEYAAYFNIPVSHVGIRLLYFRLYSFLKKFLPKTVRKNITPIFRKYYKIYVKCVERFSSHVLYAPDVAGASPVYLPPTVMSIEKNVYLGKNIYFDGWLFRNPKGIEKFRSEIHEYFAPKVNIRERIEKQLAPMRDKYERVVGVHIRQGDYKSEFMGGELFFSEQEVVQFMRQWLGENNLKGDTVCFFVCSDGSVDMSVFNGLHVVLSEMDEVGDLFALAMTDTILGSDSTFGAFASYYGNIPHVVFKKVGIDWAYYRNKTTYFENKYLTMVHY